MILSLDQKEFEMIVATVECFIDLQVKTGSHKGITHSLGIVSASSLM